MAALGRNSATAFSAASFVSGRPHLQSTDTAPFASASTALPSFVALAATDAGGVVRALTCFCSDLATSHDPVAPHDEEHVSDAMEPELDADEQDIDAEVDPEDGGTTDAVRAAILQRGVEE